MPNPTFRKWIAFTVSLALFMDALDATIINTAIPAMSHSLQVQPVDLKIALICYLLSLAIFIPISGWVADRFGLKRVFIFALMVFTISSFFCGYAADLTDLIIARFLQGLGGSLMLPLGRLIILRTYPRHDLVQTMNHIVMVISLGLMLGPLAGGFITDNFTWPWIFWVNIPVGVLTITLAYFFVQDNTKQKVKPLDYVGFILFGGGLSGLTFALSDISESHSDMKLALNILLISILMLVIYFFHTNQVRHPIVDTSLFKLRTFKTSILGNLWARLSFGGIPFLLPLLLQIVLHYSAQLSGAMLAPIAIGVIVVKSISLPIMRFFGYQKLLILNTLLVTLSVWSFIIIDLSTSPVTIALLTFIFGFLISMQYSGVNSLAYADLQTEKQSAATSITSTTQQLSQSFGVALAAILLRVFSSHTFQLSPQVFHYTFFTMGLVTLSSVGVFIFMMKPEDGHQMLSAPAQDKIESLK